MAIVALLSVAQIQPASATSFSCGGVNDGAALNAAIANAPDGEFRIAGVCAVDQTIKLRGDHSYIGESRTGTIIRASAPIAAVVASDSWVDNSATTGTSIRVEHLSIDGNNVAQVGVMVRSWLSVIDDIYIWGTTSDAIRLTNPSANGTLLTNTQVNGTIRNVMIEGTGRHGIAVIDPGNSITDWTLEDSWISHPTLDGLYLENSAGWQVRGNHLYGVGRDAISAYRCFGSTIDSNYIEDFGPGRWGIWAQIQGGASTTITGNRVAGQGTLLEVAGNYGEGIAAVVGNTLRGSGSSTGLRYYKAGSTKLTISSTGNTVIASTKVSTTGALVSAGS